MILESLSEKEVNKVTFDDTLVVTITQISCRIVERNKLNGDKDLNFDDENLETSICDDLLFRITAQNLLTNSCIKYKINFIPKRPDVDIVLPIGGIKDFLKADSEA